MDESTPESGEKRERPPLRLAEARVLGVLIEKAYTTPGQYPMTVNAIIGGCNQKNNRDPVTQFDEDRVVSALDRLRSMGLVTEVHMSGSRTAKYRQDVLAALDLRAPQAVLLAEMLLRGAQTVGELRSRASRMHPLESTEVVQSLLEELSQREPPLAASFAPAPGSRAPRYASPWCPEMLPSDSALEPGASAAVQAAGTPAAGPPETERIAALQQRVALLEGGFAALYDQLRALAEKLGEPVAGDPAIEAVLEAKRSKGTHENPDAPDAAAHDATH